MHATARYTGTLVGMAALGLMLAAGTLGAQESTVIASSNLENGKDDYSSSLPARAFERLAADQRSVWTAPSHLDRRSAEWLVPLAAVTAVLVTTDAAAERKLSAASPGLLRQTWFSDAGTAGLAAAAGTLYLWGSWRQHDREREAGLLSIEGTLNSLALTYALKEAVRRPRPLSAGPFASAESGSFPSAHATAVWALAGVLSHEYPGPLTKLLAYSTAAAVSVSRVSAQQHYPSDMAVGAAIGWLVSRDIYLHHYGSEAAGASWDSPFGFGGTEHKIGQPGSTFVPLDSWVYPAVERLAGWGYVRTELMGLKPWTRLECARLTDEVQEALERDEHPSEQAMMLESRLREEFSYELAVLGGTRNGSAQIESVYLRTVSIIGPALTDGYHFGQTVAYDFGRPFERGINGQAGGSARATAGPLALYVRLEYQHAPSAPAPSDAMRNLISQQDGVPLSEVASGAVRPIDRPELLEAYISAKLSNWQIVVGRQNLSWGPGPNDSMLWSDNAPAMDMVQVVNPEPIRLPGLLRHLGPVRIDNFVGRLGGYPPGTEPFAYGHTYVANPLVYGQKINIKPVPCLELAFGRRTMLGGEGGDPFTTRDFVRSYFGLTDPRLGSVPGDTESEVDWTFDVPKVRNYVVLYGDAYAEDDWIPIQNPARNPWHPGLYITRIPGLPKLDLHIEGVSTEQQGAFGTNTNDGQFNYWNEIYREGNTNDGFLIGNTVGRDGRTIEGWLTYWLSPRETLQAIYRHNSVGPDFVPGGAEWQDYALRGDAYAKSGVYLRAQLQYEHIVRYPALFQGPQNNFTAELEVGLFPAKWRTK